MCLGSRHADELAKTGAHMHPNNVMAGTLRKAREVSAKFALRIVLRVLRRCAQCNFADADPVPYEVPQRERRKPDA